MKSFIAEPVVTMVLFAQKLVQAIVETCNEDVFFNFPGCHFLTCVK